MYFNTKLYIHETIAPWVFNLNKSLQDRDLEELILQILSHMWLFLLAVYIYIYTALAMLYLGI